MSRSHRLFDLMQVLRRHRGTVSGEVLAREVGVSLRTIRRDIATLQALGADIKGEPGIGYILRPGFLLPPLSFTAEEIHALAAGAQWVSRQTDDGLAHAMQNAIAKIDAVLPSEMRRALDDNALYISRQSEDTGLDLGRVRQALREQRKMHVVYREENGTMLEQTIWPIMLGFVESRWFIAAWCESLDDFLRFRADWIVKVEFLDEYYLGNRRQLVKEWHTRETHPCNRREES
ncbi:MAG: YafY family protein [Collimonas pratensis]|uniref:helix-turn-helix transcriptional regulator n=1 Tax=Collimonas pratensis TaxID=279113 RepID=UPI003C740D03